MKKIVIIPARLQSERLPNKPLKLIGNRSMIQWTYQAALNSNADEVYVATDSNKIKDLVESFKGKAFLTSSNHQTGTDRVFEVANELNLSNEDIVVNVQGDEPFIDPIDIDQIFNSFVAQFNEKNDLNEALSDAINHDICTLYSVVETGKNIDDPNIVKVKVDECISLDFSRKIIGDRSDWFVHQGIYGYRFKCLKDFVSWEQTENEKINKLEQLRALDNGILIKVLPSKSLFHLGVDTEEDLREANEIAKKF
ncbi:MAG: 3-deoxy-manno-octulosonate cytidylyltransferase [Gammaproteobacteria bacterium]